MMYRNLLPIFSNTVTFSYQAICFVSATLGLCLGWSNSSRSSSRSSYNTKWISFRLFYAFWMDLMSPLYLFIYHIILLISLLFLCCRSCWYGYVDIWFWSVDHPILSHLCHCFLFRWKGGGAVCFHWIQWIQKNSKRNKYRKYIGQKNNSPSHPTEQILYSTVNNQRWKKKCNPKKFSILGPRCQWTVL